MHRGPQAVSQSGLGANIVHAPNAALLIDFDNVTMGIRSDLGHELRSLLGSDIIKGKVAVQRAYADWRRYPQYIVPLAESSIDMIMAPAYGSSKKNATDIRLAIDAIELVFTRPEIGTFILLSGDSDFSSLVMKIKEYGKYVIGVGIRESSSDLLVQNCDEYYSYNALAGLVKAGEAEDGTKYDPWELVTEAITRMQRNGDVMRSDRLKQVMQEIDSTFDEKNLGISKFSKFCLEAAQKGLLHVTKLDNGQLEVAPPRTGTSRGGPTTPAPAASAPAPRRAPDAVAASGEPVAAVAGEPEAREGRGRRGRRGGRGRNRGERPEQPSAVTPASADGAAAESVVQAPVITTGEHRAVTTTAEHHATVTTAEHRATVTTAEHRAPQAARADGSVGASGIRLTRDEAFSLVRDAVAALVAGDDSVPSERVRQKAFTLLGRDSESLSERNFARILRDAHDADVVDLRKRGDAFEVAAAASAPSVADQLQVKEAALKAVADKAKAASTPPAQRGMGHRSAPARGGRGFTAKVTSPPADLLLVGVVDDSPSVPAGNGAVDKPARKPRRGSKSVEAVDDEAAPPKRARTPRAKKAAPTA